MQLHDPNVELLAPGICFVCHERPQFEGGDQVIDTQLSFTEPNAGIKRGRKYLCSNCIREGARLLGFVSSEEARQTRFVGEQINASVGSLRNRIQEQTNKILEELKVFDDLPTVPAALVEAEPTRDEEEKKIEAVRDEHGNTELEEDEPEAEDEPELFFDHPDLLKDHKGVESL